jgi:hypothetical protein
MMDIYVWRAVECSELRPVSDLHPTAEADTHAANPRCAEWAVAARGGFMCSRRHRTTTTDRTG